MDRGGPTAPHFTSFFGGSMNPQSSSALVSASLFALRTFTRRVRFLASFLILASLAIPAAHAQTSASVTGVITDPSGGVIPGVTVKLKNVETSAVHTATTDNTGRYRLLGLSVGEYSFSASFPLFQDYVQHGIFLVVDQEATVNAQLVLHGADTVSVNADAAIVSVTI